MVTYISSKKRLIEISVPFIYKSLLQRLYRMEGTKYTAKDFKAISLQGKICEALIMIANEIRELNTMLSKFDARSGISQS